MKRFFFLPSPFALLLLGVALALAGCGFELRGQATMPFESIYLQAAPTAPLTIQVKRAIESGSRALVAGKPEQADVILHLIGERQEKDILTLSGGGRVSEFQLRYRISFRLTDSKNAREYIPFSEIVLQRPLTYSDETALSKQSEEALLYRDMRQDAVQQMLRRLQAADLKRS